MRRIPYAISALLIALSIPVAAPRDAAAEGMTAPPKTTVTLSQVILPGNCYDTIVTREHAVDYIAVWECDLRP